MTYFIEKIIMMCYNLLATKYLYIYVMQISHLEAVLVESLRREKLAEGDIRKLEAEIKHLSRLVIIYSYIRQSSRILYILQSHRT
jgi:hypothetical protein